MDDLPMPKMIKHHKPYKTLSDMSSYDSEDDEKHPELKSFCQLVSEGKLLPYVI